MKQDSKYLMERRNSTVVKANELIQKSRFSLSLQQQKIVLYLISQINPFDDDFKLYAFSIADFCKICGIDYDSGKNYSDLKAAIKEISDKSLWVTLENGSETLVRWIEKPYINKQSGLIEIKLDRDMKPFLLQLKSNFTKYELYWTLNFKSKYTIRLYELIKSIHFNETEEFRKDYTLDELRRLLDAENYKLFADFKRRVLVPSIEEINHYSDKNIEFVPIKSGRSVSRIRLIISSKDTAERVKVQCELESKFDINQLSLFEESEK